MEARCGTRLEAPLHPVLRRRAAYFRQMENGLWVRMALLDLLLPAEAA